MSRVEMIEVLTRNEIDWLVGDPTWENINETVQFFTDGGFHKYSDQQLTEQYENLTA